MASKFTTIKPKKPLHIQNFKLEMWRITEGTRANMLANFKRTTKTWEKPAHFISRKNRFGYEFVIEVFTTDPLYAEINAGTAFMTDVLTRNFVPKTRPGVLDSFPGRGRRLRRNGKPRPGIIPRRFDKAAAKEEERLMINRLRQVVSNFVTNSGHMI